MITEIQLSQKVQKYLESLGYPTSSILHEYRTSNNGVVDIVVKGDEGVLIVVEVKNKIPFNLNDSEEIGFHPITRQLQKNAQDLKAQYYIVSDGIQHVWLKTGNIGRPTIIPEIPFIELNVTELSESSFVVEILEYTSQYLRKHCITGDLLYDISIVFYLKISNELNLKSNLNLLDLENYGFQRINYDRDYSLDKIIEVILSRLDSISFIKNKEKVLLFISELFQKNRKEWILPRWVADFMVKILDCKNSDNVLDMITRYGVLMTAGFLNGLDKIISFYSNPHELYWIKIQQLLILGKETEIEYKPLIVNSDINYKELPLVSGILLAPPFNVYFSNNDNNYLNYNGLRDSTSIFLDVALQSINDDGRVVAIVPDGFLLSSSFKKARYYFKMHSYIEAIISLPQNTFAPFSSVMTSIISIKKKDYNNKPCFLAALDDFPKKISLGIENSKEAIEILTNLKTFRLKNNFNQSKLGIIAEDLDVENFHFTKYWFQRHHENQENLQDGFISIPLKELLKKIIRGSQLVADNGNIPYIGPASIRSMQLIEENLSFTSIENLPNSVHRAEENDIIINAIGSYRGSATVVPSWLEGTPINRHVILLQPNLEMILPGYLAIALNSKYVQNQFFDKSTGTVIPALNTKSYEEIFIPVPNLSRQEEIYRDHLQLLNKLNETESAVSKLKAQISQNLNSLGKEDNKS